MQTTQKLRFTWTIKHFDVDLLTIGDTLESAKFSLDHNTIASDWKLWLYPTFNRHLSLRVCLLSDYDNKISAKHTFSFVNANGELVNKTECSAFKHLYTRDGVDDVDDEENLFLNKEKSYIEADEYVALDKQLLADYMVDDALTVCCELELATHVPYQVSADLANIWLCSKSTIQRCSSSENFTVKPLDSAFSPVACCRINNHNTKWVANYKGNLPILSLINAPNLWSVKLVYVIKNGEKKFIWLNETRTSSVFSSGNANYQFSAVYSVQCTKTKQILVQQEPEIKDPPTNTKFVNQPTSPKHSNNIEYFQRLRSFNDSKEFSDITLIVDGREIKAHRIILASRSSVWHKYLSENEEQFVNITEFRYETMVALLQYFYSGQLSTTITDNVFEELLFAADRYDLQDMKTVCVAALEHSGSSRYTDGYDTRL